MVFYKDKDKGTWYIDDHLQSPDGRDVHLKKRGYRTKKEAEQDCYRQKRLLLEKLGDKTTSPDDFSGLMDGYFAAESGRVRFHTLDNELVISGKYIARRPSPAGGFATRRSRIACRNGGRGSVRSGSNPTEKA